ncbi:MAG: CRISPR-associated protein Cas4, partial [Muribaculaceae bacterium]|nr:CRISPR-associated protein Cas4 [Muribaculaceae bacterium]
PTESVRPDRFIVTPEGDTVVIDYKFTSRPREAHRRQIELYMSLLSRLGHGKAKGFLWYPLLEKIVEIM